MDIRRGTATADLLTGSTLAEELYGAEGDDTIAALDGDDLVNGNAGRDDINGNMGRDTLYGGRDDDTVLGGRDDDLVNGNLGDDLVNGNMGDDTVYGGKGNDSVYGGQGNDRLFGDLGDDWLSGDLGNDTLTGGDGRDTFAFRPGGGADVVTDFQANSDVLDLTGYTGVTSLSQLLAAATEDSGGTVLTLGGDSVRLNGVRRDLLTTNNVRLAPAVVSPPSGNAPGASSSGGGGGGGGSGGSSQPAANQAPTAQAQALTTDEDRTVTGRLAAADPDGQALTYALAPSGGPQHGTVAVNPDGSFTYTPAKDYSGTDSFTFRATDPGGASGSAAVGITVNRLADDPTLYFAGSQPDGSGNRTGGIYGVALDPEGAKAALVPGTSGETFPWRPTDLVRSGDRMYFIGTADDGRQGVFHVDLNAPEATPAMDLALGGFSRLIAAGDTLYAMGARPDGGYGIARIDPGQPAVWLRSVPELAAFSQSAAIVGNRLYFDGNYRSNGVPLQNGTVPDDQPAIGRELTSLDLGDPDAAPQLVTDLTPGGYVLTTKYPDPNYPRYMPNSTEVDNLTVAGGDLFFTGTGGLLYRYDPDQPGTSPAAVAGTGGNGMRTLKNLTVAGGDLFFTAETDASGEELYRLDLDQAGSAAVMVGEIAPGAASVYPGELVGTDTALYFFGDTGTSAGGDASGRGVYRLDLTQPGAVPMVMDELDISMVPRWSSTSYENPTWLTFGMG